MMMVLSGMPRSRTRMMYGLTCKYKGIQVIKRCDGENAQPKVVCGSANVQESWRRVRGIVEADPMQLAI